MSAEKSAKPRYQVVADSLLAQIESGELGPNDRVPSESELGEIYSVGRNTVRHAISDLANKGFLRTVQGLGTFVADTRLTKTAEYLFGFTQEMELRGRQVANRVLEARLLEAEPFLSRRLGVQLGADVVFDNRVRLMDGEPVAIERAYLPHELCTSILKHDFAETSLYRTLSEEYSADPDHAEQEIEARLATPEVARLLNLTPPAAIFVFHRETHLADGRVIEYVDSEVRADRFRFYTNLKLHAPQGEFVFQRLPVKSNV
jgi:GntR family transcriptional regulator